MLGEAIVICNLALDKDFKYHLKQRGALLAKGRILGAQFIELFAENLFFELALHANKMSSKLAEGIGNAGYKFLVPPATNQIFPILPDSVVNKLKKNYEFYVWSKVDSKNSAIRLATSWRTEESAVDNFLHDLK